ncbi:MAG: alpha/beta fold hydrolase [Polyangiaceae bacterium]|nr:alpha/beta fold hydrolase [Polyangiaceae bacterium]
MRAIVDGQAIHYDRVGCGPPLYFLHGGPGLDHTYFRPFVDPLSSDAELVFYDQLGNGRSDRPSVLTCGVDGWARELEGLRAELGHERIDLVAHSFGVLIAAAYALAFPDRVGAAVLVGAPSVFDFPGIYATRRARPVSAPNDDESFRQQWLRRLPSYFHRFDSEVGAALDRNTRYAVKANQHGIASLSTFDLRARAKHWSVPSLVVAGRHDNITTLAEGARPLAAALPGSELVVFEQSGHFPFIEEQARFVDVVRAYLRRPRGR